MPTQIWSRNWKRRKKNKAESGPEPEAESEAGAIPGTEAASIAVGSRYSIDRPAGVTAESPDLVAGESFISLSPEPENPEPPEDIRIVAADPDHAARQAGPSQEPDPYRSREQAGVGDAPEETVVDVNTVKAVEEAPAVPAAVFEETVAPEDDPPAIEAALTEGPVVSPEAALPTESPTETPVTVSENRVGHDVPDDDLPYDTVPSAVPDVEEISAEPTMPAATEAAPEMVATEPMIGPETVDLTAQELLVEDTAPQPGAVMEAGMPSADTETLADEKAEETKATFEELAEILAGAPEPAREPGQSDPDNVAGSGEVVVTVASETGEDGEVNGFEAYVAAQEASREAVPELEEVIDRAAERTLEETLTDLARMFEGDGVRENISSERMATFQTALKEAEELMRQSTAGTADSTTVGALGAEADVAKGELEPATITVTPDLTDKLLVLLRTIGHDNPREALVGLVSRRGFVFLAEAVTHLQRLSDDTGRLELSRSWLGPAMVEEAAPPLTTRLGRTPVASIVAPVWFEVLPTQAY